MPDMPDDDKLKNTPKNTPLTDADAIFAKYKDPVLYDDDDDDVVSAPEKVVTEDDIESNAALSNLKGKIETVLFVTGKALTIQEIAEIVGTSVAEAEDALIGLMQDMAFREGSALEIDDTDGYILQVREEYADIVNKMMPLEISPAELRSLSAIALKGPVLQSDLVELRGAVIYEHIPNLLARKLISKRREGRSFVLNVTRNFYEYFKLLGDKKDLRILVDKFGREPGRRALAAAVDDNVATAAEEEAS